MSEASGAVLDEDRNDAKFMGKRIAEIPCFRNSLLYGITGGIGSAIAFFAFTSKVRAATNFGVWSYAEITFSYWCYCRYNYSVTKFEYQQIRYAMQQNARLEGTDDDMRSIENLKPNTSKSSSSKIQSPVSNSSSNTSQQSSQTTATK